MWVWYQSAIDFLEGDQFGCTRTPVEATPAFDHRTRAPHPGRSTDDPNAISRFPPLKIYGRYTRSVGERIAELVAGDCSLHEAVDGDENVDRAYAWIRVELRSV